MNTEFKKGGFNHRQLKREGRVALFERTKDGAQLHYEVARITAHGPYSIAGVEFPAGESYPSPEQWGVNGFTFTDRAEAEARFATLAAAEEGRK